MAQHYAVIKQEKKWSRHGGHVTEITMVGLNDRLPYTTWIDPMNMNSKYWQHITRTPEHGFILTGLKKKKVKDRDDVINADSKPIISWEHHSQDEMIEVIMDEWRRQDGLGQPPSFHDFFRGEDA
jgi:hypothetical protein